MGIAPSGTVSFLFTDVEGSTRLWEEHPDEMPAVLARHDALLRAAVEQAGGLVVKSTGDGTLAAFGEASAAVEAALVAQQALAADAWEVGALRVRMGVHTGTATERDGDYFGPTLNRAARLMAIGHGEQVLVSDTTRSLDTVHEFLDLGLHGLRDLTRPQQVFQLVGNGLRESFPPLRSLENATTNLPTQVTTFVGRDDDIAALREHVRAHRLVTLTGVGGVGKTRLSLQVAATLLGDFPDGVWSCELAAAQEEDDLLQVVASSLGVSGAAGATPLDAITSFLRVKHALVLLDNCEHLLDAAATLAEAVLTTCPGTRLLATTREVLSVSGEHVYGLRSLDVADGHGDAVELFVERAQSARSDFVLDDTNADAVAEICRRLDGIPLAIELAAARVLALQPSDIVTMLDQRFRLLTGGRRSKLERHQTLRATVDWSYSLLSETERLVFERLGVFPASFDVEAATAVASGDGVEPWDVVDALVSLVGKSMLTLESDPSSARYQLLETMRQYALERLVERDDVVERRRAHAAYFAELAEREGPRLVGRDEIAARRRLVTEVDNLRAAVSWALDAEADADALLGLRIIAGIAILVTSARAVGVGAWAERAVARVDIGDPAVRLAVVGCAALNASNLRGDQVAARRYADLAACDPLDSGTPAAVLAAGAMPIIDMSEGRIDAAIDGLSRAARELEQIGDRYGAVTMRALLPIFLAIQGDIERARAVARVSTLEARELGNPTLLVTALYADGMAHIDDDPDRALACFEESLAITAAGGSDIVAGDIQAQLARLRAQAGDLHGALAAMSAGFEHAVEVGHRPTAIGIFWFGVEVIVKLGAFEVAAIMNGSMDRSIEVSTLRAVPVGPQAFQYGKLCEQLRAELGEERYEELAEIGAAMSYDDTVAYARGALEALIASLPSPE